jgi:hypothetical protein
MYFHLFCIVTRFFLSIRRQVYTGGKSRLLGRMGTAFFILVTYAMTLLWCLLCCGLVIIAFFFVVSRTHCMKHGVGEHWQKRDCFNITVLLDGFPFNLTALDGSVSLRFLLQICCDYFHLATGV